MKISFSGTRKGMSNIQKKIVTHLLSIYKPDKVRHGDCIGADNDFHNIAKDIGIDIILHPPINEKYRAFCDSKEILEAKDYLDRNRDMINSSELLLATPKDKEVLRSGTWMSIRYAISRKIPVWIIYPDGKINSR